MKDRDEKKKIKSRSSRVTSLERHSESFECLDWREEGCRAPKCAKMHPTGVACEKSKVSHKSVGRKRERAFSRILISVRSRGRDETRGEERRDEAWRGEARRGEAGVQKRKADCRYPRATLNSDNGMTWSYHHLHLRARTSSTIRQGRLPWRNKLARRVRHLRPSDFNNKAAGNIRLSRALPFLSSDLSSRFLSSSLPSAST